MLNQAVSSPQHGKPVIPSRHNPLRRMVAMPRQRAFNAFHRSEALFLDHPAQTRPRRRRSHWRGFSAFGFWEVAAKGLRHYLFVLVNFVLVQFPFVKFIFGRLIVSVFFLKFIPSFIVVTDIAELMSVPIFSWVFSGQLAIIFKRPTQAACPMSCESNGASCTCVHRPKSRRSSSVSAPWSSHNAWCSSSVIAI